MRVAEVRVCTRRFAPTPRSVRSHPAEILLEVAIWEAAGLAAAAQSGVTEEEAHEAAGLHGIVYHKHT